MQVRTCGSPQGKGHASTTAAAGSLSAVSRRRPRRYGKYSSRQGQEIFRPCRSCSLPSRASTTTTTPTAGSSRITGTANGRRWKKPSPTCTSWGRASSAFTSSLASSWTRLDKPNDKQLDRLGDLLKLAERERLYLDLTGLGATTEGRARLVRQSRRRNAGTCRPDSGRPSPAVPQQPRCLLLRPDERAHCARRQGVPVAGCRASGWATNTSSKSSPSTPATVPARKSPASGYTA